MDNLQFLDNQIFDPPITPTYKNVWEMGRGGVVIYTANAPKKM